MPIHHFVDIITTSVSLRVKQNPLKDSFIALSTDVSQHIPYTFPTPALSSNLANTYSSTQESLYVKTQHLFFGLTPALYLGTPNVLNIVALNIKPATLSSVVPLNSYVKSTTYQLVPFVYSEPLTHVDYQRYNYYNVEKSIYIPSTEDTLELDWNAQTNRIAPQEFLDAGSDPDPGNGNGGQSTLKEFWA